MFKSQSGLSKLGACIVVLMGALASLTFLNLSSEPSAYADESENFQKLTYTINRSNVPDLYHNDLTLIVNVGAATNVAVDVNGVEIPSTYNAGTGLVQFTTSADSVNVSVDNQAFDGSIGAVEKAQLKHNKKWAWSHGFDDNSGYKPSIEAFEAKGWKATLFMIASVIDPTRQEDWIVDRPDLINYLNEGWAVGSHGYLNLCNDATVEYQQQAFDILDDIVALTDVPDYKILSFAVPCFDISSYGSVIDTLIAGNTVDIEFYESGGDYMRLADSAYVVPKGGSIQSYSADDVTANGVELNSVIGRDFRFEGNSFEDRQAVKDLFDWMATHSNENRHFWYNTLAHGGNETGAIELLNYLDTNYGPNGTDEVWVAPSSEIYSYILVRDNTTVSLVGSNPTTPTPTPTPIVLTDPDYTFLPYVNR